MAKTIFNALHPATGGGFDAVETGQVVDVTEYENMGVVVTGTFVATILIEISYDGSTWALYPSGSLTAPGVLDITVPLKQIRARCSAWTSGLAVVYIGAKDTNLG